MKYQSKATQYLLIILGIGLSGCYTQFSSLDRIDDNQFYPSSQEVNGYYDWSGNEAANEGQAYQASTIEKPYLYQDDYFDNEVIESEADLMQSGIQYQDLETRQWYEDNDLQGVYWEGYDDGFDEGYDYGYADGQDDFRNRAPGRVYTTADFGYNQALFENYWGTRWAFQYRFNYALAHSTYAVYGNIYPYYGNIYSFYRYRNPSRLGLFASFGNGCVGFNNWGMVNSPFVNWAGNSPCLPFGQYSLVAYGWELNDWWGYGPLYGFYGHRGGIWGFNNNYIVVNNYYNNRKYGRTRAELYRKNPRTSGIYARNNSDLRSRSSTLRNRSGSATRSGLNRAGISRNRSSSSGRSSSISRRSSGSGSSGSSGIGRSRSSGSSGSSGVGRSRSGGSSGSSGSSGRSGGSSGSSSGKRGGGGSLSSSISPDTGTGYRPSTQARIARTNALLKKRNSTSTASRNTLRSREATKSRSSVSDGSQSLRGRINSLLQQERSSRSSVSQRSRVSSPVNRSRSTVGNNASSRNRVRTTIPSNSRVRSSTRSGSSRSSSVRRSSSSSRSSSSVRSSSRSSSSRGSSSSRSRGSSRSSSSKRGGN
ncbi:hypothetical protein AB2B38_003810 [Balneola sp. MJW-20]|uniref:hypothetical protein n=1 Tax=Gracilimonas aurantiaca TaxID=3234185 RepID=UPI0034679F1B